MNPARVLIYIQLLIVCLGMFALRLLTQAGDLPGGPALVQDLGGFMARYGLWFFLCPILNAVVAAALFSRVPHRVIMGLGVTLTVILGLLFGVPLLFHLR